MDGVVSEVKKAKDLPDMVENFEDATSASKMWKHQM